MKGFPKTLNTKEDYEYIRANFSKEEWVPAWQRLLDERQNWFPTGYLDSKEAGKTDELHKVSEEMQYDGTTKYVQLELQTDPGCRLKQLGFTVDYVEKAIKAAEA